MTLKIEISNVNSSQAVDFIAACRDVQDLLNEQEFGKSKNDIQYNLVAMQFEFKDDPQYLSDISIQRKRSKSYVLQKVY